MAFALVGRSGWLPEDRATSMHDFYSPRDPTPQSVPLPIGSRPPPSGGTDRRLLIGMHVGTGCEQITGALVAVSGQGLSARFDPIECVSQEVSGELQVSYQRLLQGGEKQLGDSLQLAAALSKMQLSLVRDLLGAASVPASEVLVLGVHDPGLWHFAKNGTVSYLGLCNAAFLAETSGMNVVDSFPARDLAGGGLGGPVSAIPQWLLLRTTDRTRLLLNVGRSVELTYLPTAGVGSDIHSLLSFDVGPGTFLLDKLSARLSAGRLQCDPGGRLAVQGKKIPELIRHWLADPYFEEVPPRWHPQGVRPDWELDETVRMAAEAGWSIRDLLCTATHFIADCIDLAITSQLPPSAAIDDIFITGGGQGNGMLLGEIALRFPDMPLRTIAEIGWPAGLLEATTAAVLAALHVDMVPANHPSITGTQSPRVLGRLTPGSPGAWRTLVGHLYATAPTHTSLRNAV